MNIEQIFKNDKKVVSVACERVGKEHYYTIVHTYSDSIDPLLKIEESVKKTNTKFIYVFRKYSIGETFRKARKDKKLTQCALSKEIGCSQSQIASWEKNVVSPRCEMLLKIMEFFNLEVKAFKTI